MSPPEGRLIRDGLWISIKKLNNENDAGSQFCLGRALTVKDPVYVVSNFMFYLVIKASIMINGFPLRAVR